MEQQRTLRVGLTAILLALVLRMCTLGIPEKLLKTYIEPKIAAFFETLETGQDVRFSPSLPVFSPDFVESPAPEIPVPETEPLPSFSDAASLSLYYASKVEPDIAALLEKPLRWELRQEGPTVLILHTHATESYTRNGEEYQETSLWRTDNEDYNMLSLGERVRILLEAQGIQVIQDRQLHDYPSYNGAYTQARGSLRSYLQAYPSIRLVLDLHRDASEGGTRQIRPLVEVEGQPVAQLMLVVGTNHEHYEENLSLALKLHAQLERQAPGITRPLQLRASRFNQDLSPGGLLIEIGAAGNTHQEAMAAAEQLAAAIAALASGTAAPEGV